MNYLTPIGIWFILTTKIDGLAQYHIREEPNQIIERALDLGKTNLYCLFSGGKDSTTASDLVATQYPEYYKGNVYTMTGMSLRESRWFVTQQCHEQNRPLFFTWAKKNYVDWVLENGFGGQGVHNIVMFKLKFLSWRMFLRGKEDKSAFISGVRKKESVRRSNRLAYKNPIDFDNKTCMIKPIFYKNGLWLWDYIAKQNLKVSPVNDILGISGDCLCGCFAEKHEIKLIEKYYPYMFSAIKWLEKEIQRRGSKTALKHPTWGSGASLEDIEMQTQIKNWFAECEEDEGLEPSTLSIEEYCTESCSVTV
uniref:ORF40 n=1 Tax=Nitrosopumilaceae spindle-shaped virus TaxID=3065433 RepID=A0AAT9J7D6_9VIRU